VFATPRRSAPLSERPPPCHLERRPAANDPDCRCSLMLLVFRCSHPDAATVALCCTPRAWTASLHRSSVPRSNHAARRLADSPPSTRADVEVGPDLRATPAKAWPEPPPRRDRSRYLEPPEGRRARANRPQARVAEVGRASHRSSRPPAWDAVRESPSHHRRPSVRTAANALPYCFSLVRPTISPSAASGAHRCSNARAVSIAPSLRRCKTLLARARLVKAPIDGCKALLDGCPHERSPDALCGEYPTCRTTRKAARYRPNAHPSDGGFAPGARDERGRPWKLASRTNAGTAGEVARAGDWQPGVHDAMPHRAALRETTAVSLETPTCRK
jgi:hypothetical protein